MLGKGTCHRIREGQFHGERCMMLKKSVESSSLNQRFYAENTRFSSFFIHENMRVRNGPKSGNLGPYPLNFFGDFE